MESDRLKKLKQKLKAREGTPGYEKNCDALLAEIKRLSGAEKHEENEPEAGR